MGTVSSVGRWLLPFLAGLVGAVILAIFLSWFVAPVAFFLIFFWVRAKQDVSIGAGKAHSLLELVGATQEGDGVYSYGRKDGSVAINSGTKKLAVMVGKYSKVYDFADVRGWKTSIETPGRIYGGPSVAGVLSTSGSNSRMRREAIENTGLFIEVKDIDHPVWRIPMFDKKQQQRWMEILRQVVNGDT